MYIYPVTRKYKTTLTPVLLFAGLAIFTLVVFYPALNSGFLLDDFQNLRGLELVKDDGWLSYILSGGAGPTGRPLSLLTFALQHNSWPADPFAFKLVNLIIHLCNGGLVFLITDRLIRHGKIANAAPGWLISFFVSGIWLLHPIQLTAVLYVVQRMTLLSGMFILLGIYLYIHYRTGVLKENKGRFRLVASVYLCTLLATFSKENGALLPVFLLCVELFLSTGKKEAKVWYKFILPVLLIPVGVLCLGFVFYLGNIINGYAFRDFTLAQRLLTEAGILLEYLRIILIPNPHAFSLYHDDYPVAAGLFNDPWTVVHILVLVLLVIAGILLRKKYRVYTFAIFWFLAGHIIESSFIPLELYFEHRNYIPSYGVIFLISIILFDAVAVIRNRILRIPLIVLYPLLVISVTLIELPLWSNPLLQATEWARLQPHSRRALVNLWNVYIMSDNKAKAQTVKRRLERINNRDIFPEIKYVTVTYCYNKSSLNQDDWQNLIKKAGRAESVKYDTVNGLNYIIVEIARHRCEFRDLPELRKLIYVLIGNASFSRWRGLLYEYATTVSILMDDSAGALQNIKMAVNISPTYENKLYMIRILQALGMKQEASVMSKELKQTSIFDLNPYQELNKITESLEAKPN